MKSYLLGALSSSYIVVKIFFVLNMPLFVYGSG